MHRAGSRLYSYVKANQQGQVSLDYMLEVNKLSIRCYTLLEGYEVDFGCHKWLKCIWHPAYHDHAQFIDITCHCRYSAAHTHLHVSYVEANCTVLASAHGTGIPYTAAAWLRVQHRLYLKPSGVW